MCDEEEGTVTQDSSSVSAASAQSCHLGLYIKCHAKSWTRCLTGFSSRCSRVCALKEVAFPMTNNLTKCRVQALLRISATAPRPGCHKPAANKRQRQVTEAEDLARWEGVPGRDYGAPAFIPKNMLRQDYVVIFFPTSSSSFSTGSMLAPGCFQAREDVLISPCICPQMLAHTHATSFWELQDSSDNGH